MELQLEREVEQEHPLELKRNVVAQPKSPLKRQKWDHWWGTPPAIKAQLETNTTSFLKQAGPSPAALHLIPLGQDHRLDQIARAGGAGHGGLPLVHPIGVRPMAAGSVASLMTTARGLAGWARLAWWLASTRCGRRR